MDKEWWKLIYSKFLGGGWDVRSVILCKVSGFRPGFDSCAGVSGRHYRQGTNTPQMLPVI